MTLESRPVHGSASVHGITSGSSAGGTTTKRIWNKQLVIGAALLAVVVFLQWPMLKGMFYKVAGIEAPQSAIAWRDSLDSAKAEAASSGKPILLVFSASWCPACMVMDHEVWSDTAVGDVANKRFVPVHIDVDDREQAAVARRYEVGAIPTVLILDGEGRVLREAASMSTRETLEFLGDDFATNRQG